MRIQILYFSIFAIQISAISLLCNFYFSEEYVEPRYFLIMPNRSSIHNHSSGCVVALVRFAFTTIDDKKKGYFPFTFLNMYCHGACTVGKISFNNISCCIIRIYIIIATHNISRLEPKQQSLSLSLLAPWKWKWKGFYHHDEVLPPSCWSFH